MITSNIDLTVDVHSETTEQYTCMELRRHLQVLTGEIKKQFRKLHLISKHFDFLQVKNNL